MANEYEVKTSDAAGLSGTESPVESPVDVPVLYFDVGAFMQRPLMAYRPERPEQSWVYLMRCDKFVKVGISNNVQKRLRGLQGAVPFEVKLAKTYKFSDRQYAWLAENTCHAVMSDYRTYGEWFDIPFPLALEVARTVIPATRRLMGLHRQVMHREKQAKAIRYKTDPDYRAKMDAIRADSEAWLAKDDARRKALRQADREFDQQYETEREQT